MRRGQEGRIQKGLVFGQGGKSTEKITRKKARGRASSSLWKVALQRLEEQSSSVPFSTYASILRGCCVAHCLPLGRRAHAILIARGLEQDHYLGILCLVGLGVLHTVVRKGLRICIWKGKIRVAIIGKVEKCYPFSYHTCLFSFVATTKTEWLKVCVRKYGIDDL